MKDRLNANIESLMLSTKFEHDTLYMQMKSWSWHMRIICMVGLKE